MKWLYDAGIRFYWLGIVISSAWNRKARIWLNGRKGWYALLWNRFQDDDRVIWFHCASLGEFEQGRPVIEMTRERLARIKIVLTFSSPSGFEKRKHYEGADFVCYLPLDTRKNARKFIQSIPLKCAVFVKYEFWYHYLSTLKKRDIPLFLVSGIFRREQIFFKWYGAWYRRFLNSFSHFFVQGEKSKQLLNQYGFDNVTVAGDTRFDRVVKVAGTNYRNAFLEDFSGRGKVIIAGSTWDADEKLLQEAYRNLPGDYMWIIAPHELSDAHLRRLKNTFEDSLLFTDIEKSPDNDARVIIVDTIGQLSFLYRYGTVAFIGGGFGKGIHNILEAAAYGLPVIFGPRYEKFQEASELIKVGGAFPVQDGFELVSAFRNLFENPINLRTSSERCRNYVLSHTGASSLVVEKLEEYF
ncbi:MAG: 3-deoxy-D-manno-octulosonic acid transferase [Bacteroidales bacterium]|nr:3-deoxy-D-manno-octulosonic acid transferase [Bacteroidales bacterium]MBN2698790.1 3-deoxy-D-manno-octulosonic acid transferase [Bacteroidales bacterium]